MEVVRDIFL